ncbi:MAG TPA: CHRD domain-containing protein [Micromonosporaceae bacterium]|nr:CHRD domain-containing protein [Micromonosporaceae bacterium]
MSRVARRSAAVVLSALTIVMVAGGTSASAAGGGRPFTTTLTGEAEVNAQGVPNQGDLDGIGTATVTVNPGLGEVCWSIEVSGVDPITAAHIHIAPSTRPGPVVVPLNPYTGGCTTVSRELALEIILNPDGYYVNVHNPAFPAGALRGQLSR